MKINIIGGAVMQVVVTVLWEIRIFIPCKIEILSAKSARCALFF